MDHNDDSTPVYLVTDQDPAVHANRLDLESSTESDNLTFSEASSQRTMSTFDSSQVTGSSSFHLYWGNQLRWRNALNFNPFPLFHHHAFTRVCSRAASVSR